MLWNLLIFHLNWENVWLYWLTKLRTRRGQVRLRCSSNCPQSSLLRKLNLATVALRWRKHPPSGPVHFKGVIYSNPSPLHVFPRGISHASSTLWLPAIFPMSTSSASFLLMLLLLLSRFSRIWLCATPEMAAHQAPPSLAFSSQEHWSVAISFSNAWKWKVKGKSLSRIQLLATPWTAAYQAPPSMGFSRQEHWSGLPLPSPFLLMLLLLSRFSRVRLCATP